MMKLTSEALAQCSDLIDAPYREVMMGLQSKLASDLSPSTPAHWNSPCIQVSSNAVDSLQDGRSITDEIIDLGCRWVAANNMSLELYHFNACFYSTVLAHGHKEGARLLKARGLCHSSSSLNCLSFVINQSNHWSLFLVVNLHGVLSKKGDSKGDAYMIHLDSCGLHDTDAIASNLRKIFNNFSASRRCTKKTLKVVNLSNVPQQRCGSNDCGIFVVLYYHACIQHFFCRGEDATTDFSDFVEGEGFSHEKIANVRASLRVLLESLLRIQREFILNNDDANKQEEQEQEQGQEFEDDDEDEEEPADMIGWEKDQENDDDDKEEEGSIYEIDGEKEKEHERLKLLEESKKWEVARNATATYAGKDLTRSGMMIKGVSSKKPRRKRMLLDDRAKTVLALCNANKSSHFHPDIDSSIAHKRWVKDFRVAANAYRKDGEIKGPLKALSAKEIQSLLLAFDTNPYWYWDSGTARSKYYIKMAKEHFQNTGVLPTEVKATRKLAQNLKNMMKSEDLRDDDRKALLDLGYACTKENGQFKKKKHSVALNCTDDQNSAIVKEQGKSLKILSVQMNSLSVRMNNLESLVYNSTA